MGILLEKNLFRRLKQKITNIRPGVSWSKALGIYVRRFGIEMCNYCNLHCEYCSASFGSPFTIRPSDVQLFCEQLKGIGERDEHRLTGGEPTSIPRDVFTEVVNIFSSYGRRLSLLTNGYDILNLDAATIKKFDKIILDDHGINHEHIVKCRRVLKPLIDVRVWHMPRHFNIKDALTFKHERCEQWISTITFSNGVIYPCCNIATSSRYHGFIEFTEKILVENGWGVANSNMCDVILQWRFSIHEFIKQVCKHFCVLFCGLDQLSCESIEITRKPNDVIFKK